MSTSMKVALAQISPVWLERDATLQKVMESIRQAGREKAQLIVFGEALVPGYPFWVELTDGARFESADQKALYACYSENAVDVERGGLEALCQSAADQEIAVYCGVIEKSVRRGGFSVYASLVYISAQGVIESVHRKLMPTHEERLVWSTGDGHGLRVHDLAGFRVGGLNCWENWMPLPRAALYGQGENVHVAVWPGSLRNTEDITRFIARESRSYVISVSGFLSKDQVPDRVPSAALIRKNAPEVLANGGSCVAAPDGSWVLAPQTGSEGMYFAELSLDAVRRERHSFDAAGHYARPDVTHLEVNRKRQSTVEFDD